jgi:hypothetical protein
MESSSGTASYVEVAGHGYQEDEAKQVIAGYALGTVDKTKIHQGACTTIPAADPHTPRWGYKTYDCIAPSGHPECEPVDYLVASGLNGRLDVASVAALQSSCPPAFRELSLIPDDVVFWELDGGLLNVFPTHECPERHLWLAWCHMITTPDIGVALTHKVLHHKRPRLFPLIDGQTAKPLGQGTAWKTIHDDLKGDSAAFAALETWFSELVRWWSGCVALSRLRLHDILLWCAVMTEQRGEAVTAGKKFI